MKELIHQGVVAQVLKTINSVYGPKFTKIEKMTFPNLAMLWIRPSVHEIASGIIPILTLMFTSGLMELLEQHKFDVKMQILNQLLYITLFYAYDLLIDFIKEAELVRQSFYKLCIFQIL